MEEAHVDRLRQVVDIMQRKQRETFEEIEAVLNESDRSSPPADEPTGPSSDSTTGGGSEPWSLPPPLAGAWEEIGRSSGGSFRWPDGNVENYREVVRYRGSGDFSGMILELGFQDSGDITGFVLGTGGGSKRAITYFFSADDDPRVKVSMIRGGGPRGRSGFGPADATPPVYARFQVSILRDLKVGKWNVQAVVAQEDDVTTMLAHTAIQAKLRRLA
jgi:hypothetical protein